MPRFRNTGGSAVVEFVLLGTPALLVFSTGVAMFLNSYVDTVLRAVVVDASRHAALADQSAESASSYIDSKVHQLLPNVKVTSRVERGLIASATIRYSSLPTLLNMTSQSVVIRAVAPIEK